MTAKERLEDELKQLLGASDTKYIMSLAEMYVTEEVLEARYKLLRRLIDDFQVIDAKGGG